MDWVESVGVARNQACVFHLFLCRSERTTSPSADLGPLRRQLGWLPLAELSSSLPSFFVPLWVLIPTVLGSMRRKSLSHMLSFKSRFPRSWVCFKSNLDETGFQLV